jgi:hypothetical protein
MGRLQERTGRAAQVLREAGEHPLKKSPKKSLSDAQKIFPIIVELPSPLVRMCRTLTA